MADQPLDDYFAALGRLLNGASRIVPKGSKITKDAVALEAGRGKGSIKKSRLVFAELIEAIDEAARTQAAPERERQGRLLKAKTLAEDYRAKWEAALARELCLLRELADLKKKLAQLTGANVLPIRGEPTTDEKQ